MTRCPTIPFCPTGLSGNVVLVVCIDKTIYTPNPESQVSHFLRGVGFGTLGNALKIGVS